ncbi:unnamed protein product, partial [Symbiodinium microadriaticum]
MESILWREAMKVQKTYCPWTNATFFKGNGLPRTDRVFDLLNCAYVNRCRQSGLALSEVATNRRRPEIRSLLVDISQSHGRKPLSSLQGDARCLTTSSLMYYMGEDRVLCAREHLLLQGYDRCCEIPECMSNADVRRAAGEGIALPPLGLLLWTLFAEAKQPDKNTWAMVKADGAGSASERSGSKRLKTSATATGSGRRLCSCGICKATSKDTAFPTDKEGNLLDGICLEDSNIKTQIWPSLSNKETVQLYATRQDKRCEFDGAKKMYRAFHADDDADTRQIWPRSSVGRWTHQGPSSIMKRFVTVDEPTGRPTNQRTSHS